LKETAGDWFESLRDEQEDTIAHFRDDFAIRYQTPDSLKYTRASEMFTRKQTSEESVDDYIMRMHNTDRSERQYPAVCNNQLLIVLHFY